MIFIVRRLFFGNKSCYCNRIFTLTGVSATKRFLSLIWFTEFVKLDRSLREFCPLVNGFRVEYSKIPYILSCHHAEVWFNHFVVVYRQTIYPNEGKTKNLFQIDVFHSSFSFSNGNISLADCVPQSILWRFEVPLGSFHLLSVPWIQSQRRVLEP